MFVSQVRIECGPVTYLSSNDYIHQPNRSVTTGYCIVNIFHSFQFEMVILLRSTQKDEEMRISKTSDPNNFSKYKKNKYSNNIFYLLDAN